MAEDLNGDTETGFKKLIQFVSVNYLNFMLWVLRLLTILITIGYFIPFFWNVYVLYYRALLCYVGVSALRLHQRLPPISFTKAFVKELTMEDSFHYIFYCTIFFPVAPVTLVLLPIFCFSLLHFASYSLELFDAIGQNSFCLPRFIISIVEFQSRNILRLIASTEIILMPFSVIFIFLGRASLLSPIFYYIFLYLRYSSRRNPYTRNMFHDLRLFFEKVAFHPSTPFFVRSVLLSGIEGVSKLGPTMVREPAQ